MTHKFHHKNKHKLDNQERRKMLPPGETLEKLGLSKGDIMADIGCGIGYFTIPASQIVGEQGKVFALDISKEMLQDVEEKIEELKLSNVEYRLIDEASLGLEGNNVTYAFMCNVLHEIEGQVEYLNKVKEVIAEEGKIVIIEWEKIESKVGPSIDHRIDKSYVEGILKEAGFSQVDTVKINEMFYGVSAVKTK